jgi:hypothetical protein
MFLPNEDWTYGPYYGAVGTFFADVTGDGKADAIVVDGMNRITVRRSDGDWFLPNEDWGPGGYYGWWNRYFFADVSGDGRADAIIVTQYGVFVRRSWGHTFTLLETWSQIPYLGHRGTDYADVTGDGRADAIVINAW